MSVRSRKTFQELVTLPDGAIPLAEASLLMAAEEYPQLEIPPYMDQLEAITDLAKPHISELSPPREKVAVINAVMFDQLGFRGNVDAYYDPRNSFFNDVLNRRLGIPITLSVVYIEVARRLRLPISGVGMPGHFIVKYADAYEDFFIDPFYSGTILTEDDCRDRIAGNFGDTIRFSERLLATVSNRQILARMLLNLKKIYIDSRSFDKGLSVVDMLLMVEPEDPSQYRDRGLLRIQLKQFEGAARDLDQYLRFAPNSEERSKVEEQLKELRRIRAMMN